MKRQYAQFMIDGKLLREIQIPPEVSYTIELIEILATSVKGNNLTTKAIASQRMPIEDLISNLEMADFCYPLKSSLVSFMDSVYFDAENVKTDDDIDKIFKVVTMIEADLTKFLEARMSSTADSKGASMDKPAAVM